MTCMEQSLWTGTVVYATEKIPVSVSLVTWQWLRVWEELKLSDDLVLVNVWEIPC